MKLQLPSPTEEHLFEGYSFYLKRDDLIHCDFSGNKARKFYYHFRQPYPNIKRIVSYGSNQSNAMYSLSSLAKLRKWQFDYFVNHIPTYLQKNPQGNYAKSLANGMCIHIGKEDILREFGQRSDTLYVHEGGKEEGAELGVKLLALEIEDFKHSKGLKKLNIFLPSGTGTTALYLQKYSSCSVYTTPCVGDEKYLLEQFLQLEKNTQVHPVILNTQKKYHFGKLYQEFYDIWIELSKQIGVEFDLIYDPKGWLVLLEHLELFDTPLLYLHQGGIIGNESMLPRYRRKFNL